MEESFQGLFKVFLEACEESVCTHTLAHGWFHAPSSELLLYDVLRLALLLSLDSPSLLLLHLSVRFPSVLTRLSSSPPFPMNPVGMREIFKPWSDIKHWALQMRIRTDMSGSTLNVGALRCSGTQTDTEKEHPVVAPALFWRTHTLTPSSLQREPMEGFPVCSSYTISLY